jgi:SAM-dependent methyltransferase
MSTQTAPSAFRCRSCGSARTTLFLDLGMMPPSDQLRREEQLTQPQLEDKYPLQVAMCRDCSLVQITETVPPEKLFNEDYIYYSSFSDSLLEHSRKNVESIIATRGLGPQSLVIELASNDGYLLQYYVKRGIPVLGIDPAEGQVRAANERGVRSVCRFFTRELAHQLRQEGKQADVIHANNVLAHVADTNGFVAGINLVLKEDGVAVLEFPYVKDLVDHGEFDTIYHEHLCYFSVHALVRLFERHGLTLNDVVHLPIHGGSLRIFVSRKKEVSQAVRADLEMERRTGVADIAYYRDFAGRAEAVRSGLHRLIGEVKAQGKRVAAYGAAAKGTILLNYAGLDHRNIDFVVDRNVHKQGRYMPGVHIPIRPVSDLLEKMPEYTLLLPWNFKDEILRQQEEYRRRGGRFIVPIPSPVVV